jgi:NitT/TauT family transport system substrate-binding protein
MRDRRGSWNRREFVSGLMRAATAGLFGVRPARGAAEPPPETTRIRLATTGAVCMAPHFVAEDLLRSEGFADVQYVPQPDLTASEHALAAGEADLNVNYALRLVVRLDAGDPVVVLAGVHTGCIEIFGSDHVRSIRDLKGKTIAAGRMGSGLPQLIGVLLGQIGLTVPSDVELVARPAPEAIALFEEGKADAFIGIPPEPQELRARRIGHVLLDTSLDRPWSQYFCCMISANRAFYRRHPVAAKRAVRAILKAADICSVDADGAARLLVDRGHTPRYDYARETLQRLAYRAWRDFEPEEALRFYGLRLHEAGLIKSSPKQLIAEGVDWRILQELRQELKG